MSTLRLTTISNQTGSASVPSDTVINGSAKAWVNFNGTGTVAIREDGNVSSITDNGTADYTINFTAAISDANYSAVGITGSTTGGSAKMLVPGGAQTTAACRVVAYVYNASQTDSDYVSVAIFR